MYRVTRRCVPDQVSLNACPSPFVLLTSKISGNNPFKPSLLYKARPDLSINFLLSNVLTWSKISLENQNCYTEIYIGFQAIPMIIQISKQWYRVHGARYKTQIYVLGHEILKYLKPVTCPSSCSLGHWCLRTNAQTKDEKVILYQELPVAKKNMQTRVCRSIIKLKFLKSLRYLLIDSVAFLPWFPWFPLPPFST